jgi:hypothetical protein
MKKKIGILAYGSLISDPREEIRGATTETTRDVITPFKIEFARSSVKRGGAPTLVPVESGGAAVSAIIYRVDVTDAHAADMLYRREIDGVGTGRVYTEPSPKNMKAVRIDKIFDLAGYDLVLSTRIVPNIEPLTAQRLAELAIESVRKQGIGRDGISYLIAAKRNGIHTPLSAGYEAEILRRTGASDLEAALPLIK